MFGLTLPKEYHSMVEDLAAHAFTDNFFMVYVGGKYQQTTKAIPERLGEGVEVYEVNKAERTSQRVY